MVRFGAFSIAPTFISRGVSCPRPDVRRRPARSVSGGLAVLDDWATLAFMKVAAPLSITLPPTGLRFGESVHAPGFAMPMRVDPFHKLLLVVGGEIELHRAGVPTVRAPTGTTLLVPARQRHFLADVRPATVMLMCFSRAWLNGQADLAEVWNALRRERESVLRLAEPQRHRLEAQWRRALLEQNHRRPGTGALLNAAAIEIIALLGRTPPIARKESPAGRIDALTREVERSFYEPWTIDRAAARVGMSRRSFSAHFRARHGTTFWEHLNAVRLAHAAHLLRRGEHSVLGVMFSCGFNDASNFYRLFRARFGAPPLQWTRARATG